MALNVQAKNAPIGEKATLLASAKRG